MAYSSSSTTSKTKSVSSSPELGGSRAKQRKKINIVSTGESDKKPDIAPPLPTEGITFVDIGTLRSICQFIERHPFVKGSLRKELLSYTDAIFNILNHCQENYSHEDSKQLRSYFRKLSRLFLKNTREMKTNREISELCYLTAKMLKSTWLQQLKQLNLPRVVEELAPYGEPGASKSLTKSASISAGGGAMIGDNVNSSVTANLGYSHTHQFSPDDESFFYEDFIHRGSTGLSANFNIGISQNIGASANASLTGSSTYIESYEYGNVRQYANNEGTSLKDPNANLWERLKHCVQSRSHGDMKRLRRNEQSSATSSTRFKELLSAYHIEKQNFIADFPEQNPRLYGYILSTSGTVGTNAGVGISHQDGTFNPNATLVGAGASVTHTYTDLHQFPPESFVDAVKKDPEKGHMIPAHLLKKIKTVALKTENDIRAQLTSLAEEIEEYYAVVKQLDELVSSPYAKKHLQAPYRKKKHSIENKWGAIGRHNLLQIWLATIGYLAWVACNIHPKQRIGKKVLKDLTAVEKLLANPKITYDKTLLEKIASFHYDAILKISENSGSIQINAPLVSATLTCAKRYRTHPNWLREGEYLDFTVTGTLNGNLTNLIDTSASLTQTIISQAAAQGFALPEDFSLTLTPDVGIDGGFSCLIRYFKPAFSQEPNFPGKKGWRKQFDRYRRFINANANLGGGVSVLPGVVARASVGAGMQRTQVIKDVLVDNDLTYPMARFNRYFRNNGQVAMNNDWLGFVEKHQGEFRKIFLNLANPKSDAWLELCYRIDQALEQAQSQAEYEDIKALRASLLLNLNYFRMGQSYDNFIMTRDAITGVFGALVAPWWRRHQTRWGELEYRGKKDNGLSFGSKLKKDLGFTSRGKPKFEQQQAKEPTAKRSSQIYFETKC